MARHRRVVVLSDVDRRLIEAGMDPLAINAAPTVRALPAKAAEDDDPREDRGANNDAVLRENVPPHWGPRTRG